MSKVIIALALLQIVAFMPSAASASIRVTIQVLNADGTVFQSRNATQTGFNLVASTVPASSTVSGNTTLNILSSSPRFFPSGGTTAVAGDTFKFENVGTTPFQCKKTDPQTTSAVPNPAQLLEIKGLKATVTAAGTGKKLRVICETQATQTSGDYRTLTSTSGTYTAKAALKGELRNSTSTSSATNFVAACNPLDIAHLTNPCLKLELNINRVDAATGQIVSVPVNGSDILVTTSVPCSNSIDTNPSQTGTQRAACGPNGVGGTWNPSLIIGDQFNTFDQGNVGCGTTCRPIFKVTMTGGPFVFNTATAQGEFVKLTSSVSVGLADGGIEDPLGQENLESAFSSEVGTNTWRGYCGNLTSFSVVPRPPLTNQTRNAGPANTPLKFAGQFADLIPATSFTMESVGHGDELLPLSARKSDDACYLIHIPPPEGKLKDVTDVTLTYNFVIGEQASSYSTLAAAPPLTYADCFDACFKAYISLEDKDHVFKGRLIVYLGNSGQGFTAQPATGPCCNGVNLEANGDARVDPSGMLGNLADPCCTTFDSAKNGKLGNLFVRSFIVVLNQGSVNESPLPLNHRLVLTEASFNGSEASDSLQIAGAPVASCVWPPLEALRMAIYKTPNLNDPVKTLTNLSIDPTSCELRGDVVLDDINPDPGGTTYHVWVLRDGNVPVPNVGVMNIFAGE